MEIEKESIPRKEEEEADMKMELWGSEEEPGTIWF